MKSICLLMVHRSDYPCDFGSDVVEAPPEPGPSARSALFFPRSSPRNMEDKQGSKAMEHVPMENNVSGLQWNMVDSGNMFQ